MPLAVITDPRKSRSCWSAGEVTTPDGVVRQIACGRGRHRWGRHRNREATWRCPKGCLCVRHASLRQASKRLRQLEPTREDPS